MTPFTIYLWQLADSIKNFFGFTALIFFCAAVAVTSVACLEEDATTFKIGLSLGAGAFLAGMFASLIPSSKTIAMMVAIPAIANSEPIQKDIPELYQLAKEALKEQIVGGKKTETK